MTEPTLSASEIIAVIEACHRNSVTQFQLGALAVTFAGYRPPVPEMSAFTREDVEAKEWLNMEIPPNALPTEGL